MAGPTAITTPVVSLQSGQPTPLTKSGVLNAAARGQCLTDTFVVTNPGGITPPTICGTNTGEHSIYNYTQFLEFYNVH